MYAPHVELSLKADTGFATSRAMSRTPRRVGVCGETHFKGNLRWLLSDAEFASWQEWWATATVYGQERFSLDVTTGPVATPHTFQALEGYSFTRDTGVYAVTLPVKVIYRGSTASDAWATAFYGPPAEFPYEEVPSPQWGYSSAVATTLLSTGGHATAFLPINERGSEISFSWKLSPEAFDYLLKWWEVALNKGYRKFVFSTDSVGPWLCSLLEDPTFSVNGAEYSASMKMFARAVDALNLNYLYNRDEGTAFDYLVNVPEGVAADTYVNQGGH